MNAGVMLPTTVRARRDPKWPESWEKDWDRYEDFASEMLRVQSVQTVFQNSKIMQQVVDREYNKNIHEEVKLSMNFNMEESRKSQQSASCLACGNCLAGCPYNAKNSTDKNYLVSATEVCFSSYEFFFFIPLNTMRFIINYFTGRMCYKNRK